MREAALLSTFFSNTTLLRRQLALDRARTRLGRHKARYREASAATIELRSLLAQKAERMLARSRARLSRDVFDAADVDNSGAIDKGEFADYIAADPRLLQWLEATGAWWVELGGVIAAREVKEGVARGALGLTGLDIAGCASPEGAAEPTSLLLEAILPQLREVSFHRLVRLVKTAINEKKPRLTKQEWLARSAEAGLRHTALASALFDVWATSGAQQRGVQGERLVGAKGHGDVDAPTVQCVELVCGLAMLDPELAGNAQAVTSFTFSLIDLDQSGEIEPQELANFLRLFRRPILTDAARALAGFFRLCGFEEEYREAVDAMLELAIKRCITVFVDHAFKSSDENVDFLMSYDEFKVWCRLNTNVTSWVAQLSSFVLNQLQIRKLITVAELS